MKTKTTSQKRKHAELIRITARERNDAELPAVMAYADRLEAEADLEDALSGVEPRIAEHAEVEQIVPVLGRIVYSGGVIRSMDQEWIGAQVSEAKRRGIMLTWQWVRSLDSPDAGMCSFFYAGTRESGPLVQWSASDGYWRRLKSAGDYGKNWACGGHFPIDRIKPGAIPPAGAIPHQGKYVYHTFEACNAGLCQTIKDIIVSQLRLDGERIAKARVNLAAARLRQTAVLRSKRATGGEGIIPLTAEKV